MLLNSKDQLKLLLIREIASGKILFFFGIYEVPLKKKKKKQNKNNHLYFLLRILHKT